MRFLLVGCLVLAAGCGAAPPASLPVPPPPSPPPAASISVEPPSVLRFRWSVEEDFVQGAGAQLPVRPLDVPLIVTALPQPHRGSFSALVSKENPQEKEAASLADRMEKQAPRTRGKEAAALWLAAGWLVETAGLSAGEKTPLQRAERDYQKAAWLVPASTPLGAEARYRLALALTRSRRGDLGKTALEELIDTRSDHQPEAAARLGALLERAGAPPEEAGQAYLRGIEGQIPAAALVRGALVHGWMIASYRQGKYAVALSGALDFLRGFRGSGPPSVAAEGALRIAADSLEHLGVDDLLARPFAPESAEVLLRLAWRAIRREDFPLAERLSTYVLVGAPLGWHAPAALRIAISAADLAPQEVLAQERRARLTRDFGPSSPWAEAQRLARGKDGWPSEAVILSASKPLPPPAEESLEARVEARLRALVRLCLEPLAWRRGQLPEAGLTISLKKAADSPMRVTLNPDGETFSGLVRCMEKFGPVHLRGILARVEAEVTWGGDQKARASWSADQAR